MDPRKPQPPWMLLKPTNPTCAECGKPLLCNWGRRKDQQRVCYPQCMPETPFPRKKEAGQRDWEAVTLQHCGEIIAEHMQHKDEDCDCMGVAEFAILTILRRAHREAEYGANSGRGGRVFCMMLRGAIEKL